MTINYSFIYLKIHYSAKTTQKSAAPPGFRLGEQVRSFSSGISPEGAGEFSKKFIIKMEKYELFQPIILKKIKMLISIFARLDDNRNSGKF